MKDSAPSCHRGHLSGVLGGHGGWETHGRGDRREGERVGEGDDGDVVVCLSVRVMLVGNVLRMVFISRDVVLGLI